jgi:hypothetical protein
MILSIITRAVQELRFPLPAFWNIPLKRFYTYEGVVLLASEYVHFGSRSTWHDPPELSDLPAICRTFSGLFPEVAAATFVASCWFHCENQAIPKELNLTWVQITKSCIRGCPLHFTWERMAIGTEFSLSSAASVTFDIGPETDR